MNSQWNAITDRDSSSPTCTVHMYVCKKFSMPMQMSRVCDNKSKDKSAGDNWNDDQDFSSIQPLLGTHAKKKFLNWNKFELFFIMGSMNSMVSRFAIKVKTASLLRSDCVCEQKKRTRMPLIDLISRNKTPNNIIWFQVTLMALLNPSCGRKNFPCSTEQQKKHRYEYTRTSKWVQK